MTASTDDLVDRLVDGRYRVERHLADGGMGSVYVALDERLDRHVALKVMRADLARDAAFVERFRREARAAARLGHPNVVAVFDQGQDGGVVFLAMEYVVGRTLRAVLDSGGAMVPADALRIQRQILAALAAAHRAGIVHRDIKPENVLIGPDDHVKVADFGLARAAASVTTTTAGVTAFGTVCYLAPEQVESGRGDARSDVYAAGLVLSEMLTGRRAVDGDTPLQVAYRHVHGEIAAPSAQRAGLARGLDDLVATATRRDPDERPQDAAEFLAGLDRVAAGLTPEQLNLAPPGVVNPAGPQHTNRLISRTRPVPALAGVAAGSPESATAADAQAAGPTGAATGTTSGGATAGAAAGAGTGTGGPAAAGEVGDADVPPPAPGHSGSAGAASSGDGRGARTHLRSRIIGAIAAAVLLIGGGIGWYAFLGPGSHRVVPKVVGLTQDRAVAELGTQDLRADIAPTFSDDVKAGLVISADPGEGAAARRATSVRLAVSKGPDVVQVPPVVGQAEDAAKQAIQSARLTPGARSEDFSETVAAGQVVSTDPAVGSTIKAGKAVAYVVSKGRRPFDVPDWTGKPFADAKKALDAAGITAKVTAEEFSTDVPKGAVLTQAPTSGTLYKGDQITFTLSKGPDLVKVPNVVGKSQEDATALLKAAGFQVRVNRIAGGLFGLARSTDPAGDSQAPRGSTVTLSVV